MPVQIRTDTDTRQMDDYLLFIRSTPQNIQTVVKRYVVPTAQQITTQQLAPYPPPIPPGLFKREATPKQFRYVMAKIRRGEWTGRTGALQRAWVVVSQTLTNGAEVTIRNTSRVARFVVGRNQQPFHANRWIKINNKARGVQMQLAQSFMTGYRELQRSQVRRRN